MRKFYSKYLLLFIGCTLFVCLGLNACKSGGGSGIFEKDDTEEAINLIGDANLNLKRIRILYRDNKSKIGDLKAALKLRDAKKVRKLADDLSFTISYGHSFAESARENIEKAQELNINDDWKEYLRLKESSLEKQVEAFEFRQKSAKLFHDKFGSDDKLQMAKAAEIFKGNERKFAKLMEDAGKLSKEADDLAKIANRKRK